MTLMASDEDRVFDSVPLDNDPTVDLFALLRQRRFVRAEGQGGGGGAGEAPRYRQTSNSYRPLLPAAVRAYLPRWLRPAPGR